MKKLVFLLEKYSAAEMLKGILPKFLPNNTASDFKVFEGKQDMERRLSGILSLGNPAEELFRLTGNIYQKVTGSRAIAPYMNLEGNRSQSFNILVSSIRKIVETTSKLI